MPPTGQPQNTVASPPIPLPKVQTFIEGLDDILEGGLPANRTSLLMGSPGSGKTIMGIEFLYRGALNGDPGIFLGFEESPQALRENAQTMGWNLVEPEQDGRIFLLDGHFEPETIISGDFSLKPLLAIISGKAEEMGARRIVLDALDVLMRLYSDPVRIRAELHTLNDWLVACGMTAVMTLKPRQKNDSQLFLDFFYSMADCAINLDARVVEQISIRRLRVVKFRGSGFGRNEYPYVITGDGIKLIPISSVALHHKPFGKKISSGVPRFDALLGGGYHRASCVLLAGEPGAGKTLLASSFTRQACLQGEKVLYISYEESEAAILNNILSAGIDLASFRDQGLLRYVTILPEAFGAEEHLLRLLRTISEFEPQHVVVDAISAAERMGGKQAAYEFLMRLINWLKERGITTFLTNQTSGVHNQLEISGSGISSMVDVVVFITYVFADGETNRTIQVLKARGAAHSGQWREFKITANGLDILDVYVGVGRVLTGTARQMQEAKDALELRSRQTAIQAKEKEIEALKSTLDIETTRLRARLEMVSLELAEMRLELEQSHFARDRRAKLRGKEFDDTNLLAETNGDKEQ